MNPRVSVCVGVRPAWVRRLQQCFCYIMVVSAWSWHNVQAYSAANTEIPSRKIHANSHSRITHSGLSFKRGEIQFWYGAARLEPMREPR